MTAPPRPRLLFGAVFIWISIVGGRFLAPFLVHKAAFSDALVGTVLALSSGLLSLLGPLAGALADTRERQSPLRGRAQVLQCGILLGSAAFLLHDMHAVFPSVSLFDSTYWHFGLRLIFACAAALSFPVLDGMALAHLEREENKNQSDFGKERLHGAIWWAITNLMLGPSLDRFGFDVMYIFAVVSTVACILTIEYYVRARQHDADEATQTNKTEPRVALDDDKEETTIDDAPKNLHTRNLLRIMLGTAYGASFLFFFYCLNAGTSVVESLVFLFFEFLGGSYTMCSLTVLLTVVFEIPIFHYAPAMLNRYGAGMLQVIAGTAYVVRVIGYSLIPQGHAFLVLFLEPLHGVTYACSKTSGVEFVATLMPDGYQASGQGLLGLFSGLGCVTGLLAGGLAQDTLGPRIMYRSFAAIVLVGMSVFLCTSYNRKPELQRLELVPQCSDVELTEVQVEETVETFEDNS